MKQFYAYTRAQALKDGEQFDITRLAFEAGYKYPVFITSGVSDLIDKSVEYGNSDRTGVTWDILNILKFRIHSNEGINLVRFKVAIKWLNGHNKTFDFIAECGATDIYDLRPAITIMLPFEN